MTLYFSNVYMLQLSAQWKFYQTFVLTTLSLTFVFVYGQVSDKYRRKLPILFPFLGSLGEALVYLMNSLYMQAPLPLMLIGPFCNGIGGSVVTLLMTTVAYVTDVSNDDSRTSRVSLLYACSSLASLLSFTFSGILLDNSRYETVFALCLLIYSGGALYVIFFVREIKPQKRQNNTDNKDTSDDDKTDATAETADSRCQTFGRYLKEICLVPFIKRKFNRRVHILVLMAIVVLCGLGTCKFISFTA